MCTPPPPIPPSRPPALMTYTPPPTLKDIPLIVANPPTCGPLLILSPALKRRGPPARRGWCGPYAHLWACGPLRILSRLQSGGQNQKWATIGRIGFRTPTVSHVPRLQSREQNQKWPTRGQMGHTNPVVRGVPSASRRGTKLEEWPTSGWIGYITPTMWRVPNASKRGTKSGVAHKWAHGPHRM